MKRITGVAVLLSLLLSAGAVFAQTSETEIAKLQAKIAKNDKSIANPKKAEKYSTWLSRAEGYLNLHNAFLMNAYIGMDQTTFSFLSGKPQSTEQVTEKNAPYTVYHMGLTDFYFSGENRLEFYKVVQPLKINALDSAIGAIYKAVTRDPEQKNLKKIAKQMQPLRNALVNAALNNYKLEQYKASAHQFTEAIKLGKTPYLALKDTALYYYAGMATYLSGDHEGAVPLVEQALDANFTLDGELYCIFYEMAKAANKLEKAKGKIEAVVAKFPNQKCLVNALVDYYITKGEDPSQAMTYVDKAIALDPNNAAMFFIKGVILDKLGKNPEAEAAYMKTLELDPKNTDAYYNLAVLHYNEGVNANNASLEIKYNAENAPKIEALEQKSKDHFHKAIPFLEKILSIQPEHADAKSLLKQLYIRFRMEPGIKDKLDALNN